MPEGTLKFNLNEEEADFKRAVKATDAYICLWDIANEIFRPHRKHGYPDNRIPPVDEWTDREYKIVEVLEEKFYEILESHGVNLDDLN